MDLFLVLSLLGDCLHGLSLGGDLSLLLLDGDLPGDPYLLYALWDLPYAA